MLITVKMVKNARFHTEPSFATSSAIDFALLTLRFIRDAFARISLAVVLLFLNRIAYAKSCFVGFI